MFFTLYYLSSMSSTVLGQSPISSTVSSVPFLQSATFSKLSIRLPVSHTLIPSTSSWHKSRSSLWSPQQAISQHRYFLFIWSYSPNTSWEIDGETVETASDFIFGGSKITADGDCSHEIKRSLLLGRKVMTNLDSIFKSRDITLLTKVRLVKAIVFPVVMYGYESWTIKKAES